MILCKFKTKFISIRTFIQNSVKPMQVSGKVTYNGHEMNEFVPERTAAYIGQHDLHTGELTVRETLAFSARCQGVGTRYGTSLSLTLRRL